MDVYEKIAAQQQGKENTDVWMVGEQLKEIISREPGAAEIVSRDLDVKEMSLSAAAGNIRAYADDIHKKVKGSCVCVPPSVAEKIIRDFYGLPEPAEKEEPKKEISDFIDLEDFL